MAGILFHRELEAVSLKSRPSQKKVEATGEQRLKEGFFSFCEAEPAHQSLVILVHPPDYITKPSISFILPSIRPPIHLINHPSGHRKPGPLDHLTIALTLLQGTQQPWQDLELALNVESQIWSMYQGLPLMGGVASWAQITSSIMDGVCNPHTAEGSKRMHGSEKSMRGRGAQGRFWKLKKSMGLPQPAQGKGWKCRSVAKRAQQVGQEDSGATRGPTLGSEAVVAAGRRW